MFALYIQGVPKKDIGEYLKISEGTIATHVRNIGLRLGVSTIGDCVRYVYGLGITSDVLKAAPEKIIVEGTALPDPNQLAKRLAQPESLQNFKLAFDDLTEDQRSVVCLFAQGKTTEEISKLLYLSAGSVFRTIRKSLGVSNLIELTHFVLACDLLSGEQE